MKNNGPVTQHEYHLDEHETLLSTTDLKGRITYANEAFVRASGFEREELLGKAHNLVRHPDMPEAAFGDLWTTLEQGQTWTGVVKNRRKNGDHYWVRANVTPVRHNGAVIGYLSVRTVPSADEVRAHEAIYHRIQAGERGWRVRRGFAVPSGWRRVLPWWRSLSVAARLRLAFAVVALGSVAAPALAASAQGVSGVWLILCRENFPQHPPRRTRRPPGNVPWPPGGLPRGAAAAAACAR